MGLLNPTTTGGLPKTPKIQEPNPNGLLSGLKTAGGNLKKARRFIFPTRPELLQDIQKEKQQTLLPKFARGDIRKREQKEFQARVPIKQSKDETSDQFQKRFLSQKEIDVFGIGATKRVPALLRKSLASLAKEKSKDVILKTLKKETPELSLSLRKKVAPRIARATSEQAVEREVAKVAQQSIGIKPKKINVSLPEEARKFNTAEEFIEDNKDLLDIEAEKLFIKRNGEVTDTGSVFEPTSLERIEQFGREFNEEFIKKHPNLVNESIIVYHDAVKGVDLAVVSNGKVVEVFDKELKSQLTDIFNKAKGKQPLKFSAEGIPLSTRATGSKRNVGLLNKSQASVETSLDGVQPISRKAPLIDTATGEGRSLEKLSRREQAIVSQDKVPIKDESLIDIIKKEPTPVKQKVNVIDYIRTPDRVLSKIGLDKEARLLRKQQDKYLRELPKNLEVVTDWAKRASKGGNEQIFKWLDGDAITLKPEDLKIAKEIKVWLAKWADKLGLPKDKRITNYITHIFDAELLAKEFPEELAKMIRDKVPGEVYNPFLQKRLGTLGYKKDTWKALDAYVKRATRKIHLDQALEKVKQAADSLELSQFSYVKTYVDNINLRPGKLSNLLDNGIKQLIGHRLGQRPTLLITKTLRQMTYRAMLGLNLSSALRNISQGINTYSKLGEKYTIVGYSSLFRKGIGKELLEEGVLDAGFIEDRALSAGKKALEKFDDTLFFFFQGAEKINRGSAYFGGKAQFLNGKPLKSDLKKLFGTETPEITEINAKKYGKQMVRDTQFVFGAVDRPLILASDLGRTIFQFQSFTTKQIEFLVEMSNRAVRGDEKARNFIGLIRYALAGTAFVYTVGQSFGMEPKELIPFYRFGTPASLKVPSEVTKAVFDVPDRFGNDRDLQGKFEDIRKTVPGLIPGGLQAKKSIQGFNALQKGRSETKAGVPQFDIGGTLFKDVQALVFGKYAGKPAKAYFNDEVSYTEAIYNKLNENPDTAIDELLKLHEQDEALAERVLKFGEDVSLGVTKEERKIRNLGVANKARLRAVMKKIDKLKTEEEKEALLMEYIQKKIVTEDVFLQIEQLNQ